CCLRVTATTAIYTFPYTTLFRSSIDLVGDVRRFRDRHLPPEPLREIKVGSLTTDRHDPAHNPFLARASAYKLTKFEQHRLQLLRSEEHTSELQSRENLVCRLLLE